MRDLARAVIIIAVFSLIAVVVYVGGAPE